MEGDVKLPVRILVALLLIVPACNRNPRNTQAASEERTNAADQANVEKTDRNDYVAAIEPRLAALDVKIDQLDQQANTMTGRMKENFKKAIDDLRDQRKSVASKLDDVKKADIQSWRPLSWEVDSALTNLENSNTQLRDMIPQAMPDASSATPSDKRY
jgi:hypothetical protein